MIKANQSFDSRHFALSLKAHKDWKFQVLSVCLECELDAKEIEQIKVFREGYEDGISYNISSGGKNENGNIQKNTVKKYGVLKDKWKEKALKLEKEKQDKINLEKWNKEMEELSNKKRYLEIKFPNRKAEYDKLLKRITKLNQKITNDDKKC